ncbi:MAG: histone deacetylase [Candidatus Neomarinimicrobiota bacterium]
MDQEEGKSTGFVYSPSFLTHETGPGHPESPRRLEAILDHLRTSRVWHLLRPVTPNAAGVDLMGLVHSREYVDSVSRACSRGVKVLDGGDTVVCENSHSVALLAAGGVVEGIRLIFEDSIENAFCAVRPPGHHAGVDQAMGFCLFNNAAIGARFAQKEYRLERVMIVDWDVHHGNGTQHIFESDPTVFYVSLHQYPFYPGTGNEIETGRGRGLGMTRNFPLSAGGGDHEYLDIFRNKIPDIAAKFSPELIILSSGFDAHEKDPLANMRVSTEVFMEMTQIIHEIASEWCGGRLVSILEGGYSLDALQECTEVHLNVLAGGPD